MSAKFYRTDPRVAESRILFFSENRVQFIIDYEMYRCRPSGRRPAKFREKNMSQKSLCLLFGCLFAYGPVFGQEEYRFSNENPNTGVSAGLIPWESYGRFGPRSIRGPMIRNYSNSRFSDGGAMYDERGRWIGTKANYPTSRFKEYWKDPEFQYYGSEEYYADQRKRSIAAAEANADFYEQLDAQQQPLNTTNRGTYRPEPIPQPPNLIAQIIQSREQEAQGPTPQNELQPQREELQREGSAGQRSQRRSSQWFRDPRNAGLSQGQLAGRPRSVVPDNTARATNGVRAVGSAAFDPNSISQTLAEYPLGAPQPIPPVYQPPTQEQIAAAKQRAMQNFEANLEEMILRSPEVHLLAPVEVKFENGIATLRGMVSNEESKIKAGQILLTVPEVQQVKNLISVAP